MISPRFEPLLADFGLSQVSSRIDCRSLTPANIKFSDCGRYHRYPFHSKSRCQRLVSLVRPRGVQRSRCTVRKLRYVCVGYDHHRSALVFAPILVKLTLPSDRTALHTPTALSKNQAHDRGRDSTRKGRAAWTAWWAEGFAEGSWWPYLGAVGGLLENYGNG